MTGKFRSFAEYLGLGRAVRRLDEAKGQIMFDGPARNQEPLAGAFKPGQSFAAQVDGAVKSRFFGADPEVVIGLFRFSKGWRDELDNFSVSISLDQFGREQLEGNENNYAQSGVTVKKAQAGGGYQISMQFPGKAQGFMMAIVKKNGIKANLKFGNGLMTGQAETNKDAANVYLAACMIKNGWTPKQPFAPVEDSTKIVNHPEVKAALEKGVPAWGDAVKNMEDAGGDVEYRFQGPYKQLISVIANVSGDDDTAKAKQLLKDKAVFETNTAELTYDMVWLADQLAFSNAAKDPETLFGNLRKMRFGLEFRKYLRKLETGVDDFNQNPENKKEGKRKEYASELAGVTFAQLLDGVKNAAEEKPQEADRVDLTPRSKTAKRRMKLFEDAKYYGAQIVEGDGWIAAICRTYPQCHCFGRNKPKVKDGTNEVDPDCNLRDDEIKAKFGNDPAKVAALIKKRDGNGTWVKDGVGHDRNQCEATQCVAGDFTNNTSWVAYNKGQWFNSRKNGWDSPYFNCWAADQKMPIIYYLRLSDGRLYCSNLQYCKGQRKNDYLEWRWFGQPADLPNENGYWYQYDFNEESNGVNGGGLDKLLQESAFHRIYEKANTLSFGAWKEHAAIKHPPDFKVLKFVGKKKVLDLSDLDTTDNGMVVVKSRTDFLAARENILRQKVSAVRLDFADASSAFEGCDLHGLDVIDFHGVRDASRMFANADFGSGEQTRHDIRFLNTQNVEDMRIMFEGARGFGNLIGLDTRSATAMNRMFAEAEPYHLRPVQLPDFDLSRCQRIDQAFLNTPFDKITFKNATKSLTDAEDVIKGCFALKEPPDLMFEHRDPGVFGIGGWTGSGEDVERIFSGCTAIRQREDFENIVAALRKFYVEDPAALETTPDGLAVVRSKRDVYNYLKFRRERKYKGILVDAENGDASRLMSDMEKLVIGVLDLSKTAVADNMFSDSRFEYLGKVVNAQNVKSANYMFSGTDISETPETDFSGLRQARGIFHNCRQIKTFGYVKDPRTKFGKFEFGLADRDWTPAEYLFGTDDGDKAVLRKLSEENVNAAYAESFKDAKRAGVERWVKDHFDEANGSLKLYDAGDIGTLGLIAKKYPDLAGGVKSYKICMKAFDGRRWMTFRDLEVDFGGKPLDVSEIENIRELFQGASVKGGVKIIGAGDKKDAKSMFQSAKIDGDVEFDSLDSLENAGYMFQSCEFLKGEFKNRKFPKLVNGEYMFQDFKTSDGKLNIDFEFNVLQKAAFMFSTQRTTLKLDKLELADGADSPYMFAQCRFEGGMISEISLRKTTSNDMFAHVAGEGEGGNLEIGKITLDASDAQEMFLASRVVAVGDVSVKNVGGEMCKSMFKSSKLEFIGNPDFEPQSLPAKGIFQKSPYAELCGDDGEFLKAYMEG